tara:strand:- start:1134 stop:1379 length:246 start_codon:yes stop_codon:yes gene_type:complete
MYFDSKEKKNISIKRRTPTWEADGRDPGPANVSTGLKVQQENLRELRKFLFDELLQLQVWHPYQDPIIILFSLCPNATSCR